MDEKKTNKHYENIQEGTNSGKKENAEDVTQYGEFISTFHSWVPPEEQKRKAKMLEDATNKDHNYRKQQ